MSKKLGLGIQGSYLDPIRISMQKPIGGRCCLEVVTVFGLQHSFLRDSTVVVLGSIV
jgi:hypothetical protein